ncbi:exodeoxyribonuclease V subunit beta [Geobacter sp. DSM 9736]|uniref:UvrD-helicase domain-containing protein n=1 Tax=Geobacter sp. DSM 9736 TaxID=1277350 RepID=UPI000B5052E0|nr:UvrD-helicase domain-containing protein [Geobacter sp. DSM 9736]SNB47449.1 ATP-dependent helicase/nuclease subunit A [Geobacter sp. DSM 9736]
MQWSDVKKQVLSFTGNTIVSAGAGSGKTAVLVELYLRLLAGETSFPRPLRVEEIAAITFTDKAAVEMKERVRRGIAMRLQREDQAADWKDLLRSFPAAAISTFHAFCSQILRENPIEAGIDPSYMLLDERSAREELTCALDEIIAGELRDRTPDIRLLLRYLPLSGAGRGKGLRELLEELVRKRSGSCTTDEDLAGFLVEWDERAARRFREREIELQELCAEIARILKGKELVFHAKLRELERIYGSCVLSLGEESTATFLDSMESCIAGNWGKEKPVRDRLANCIAGLHESYWQLRTSPAAEALLRLAGKLSNAYCLRKERQGALDFEDLQIATRNLLLNDPGIRAEYRSRFPVVMVDEFQDTNPLQKELVGLLCGEEQRLFIVGDPKQSIYLFRGADVEVFGKAQAEIAASGGEPLFFQESFRSRPEIIQFVNSLFGKIVMAQGDAPFEIVYDERHHLLPQREAGDGTPCVELLTLEKDCSSAEARCNEAAAIAEKIRTLVSEKEGVRVFDREHLVAASEGRPPRCGDIVILFRRFSNLKLYERELRQRGIPYYVVKGKGFYRCQEILDIINFLRYLESERDLVALTGVLRSPLCCVSDETLFLLAREGELSRWQTTLARPEACARLETQDAARLAAISRLIDRLRPLRDRLTIAELLEEILTGTDFASTLLTTFQGEQKLANLRKLIELSRSFADRHEGALHRFVLYLVDLVETEPTEAEAVISAEGENVVRLMTVHQSKGLEFPIVFVPEIGAGQPVNNSPLLYDDQLGLGLRVAPPGREARPSLAFRAISELRRAKECAELKRLLYVAMTRARDYLLLSGEGNGDWRRWIDAFCAGEERHLLKVTPVAVPPPPDRSENPTADATLSPERLELGVARALHYRSPGPSTMLFSPTALEDYLQCPRKYFYKGVMGLDEGLFKELLGGPHDRYGQTGGMTALEKGNLAHAMLELVDFDAPPLLQRASCAATAARMAAAPVDAEEVTAHVIAFAASPAGRVLAKRKLLREHPFTLKLEGAATYYVKGAMDLVAIAPDLVSVYDYKYVERERADLDGYRFQLRIYMLALSSAFPTMPIEGRLVFLKGGEIEEVAPRPEERSLLLRLMDDVRTRSTEEDFGVREGCDGRHCPFYHRCRTSG